MDHCPSYVRIALPLLALATLGSLVIAAACVVALRRLLRIAVREVQAMVAIVERRAPVAEETIDRAE